MMMARELLGDHDMKPKWYSHWYSGDLKSGGDIWQQWHDLVTEFFVASNLKITHFGADSDAFRSGKYLQYGRSRKRLEKALHERLEFTHLSYVEMNGPFETLAAEYSFGASLNSKGIEVDVRLDNYDQDLCDSFRVVGEQFFRNGRLITFKTPARIQGIPYLPSNLPWNYDLNASDIADGYIDVSVSYFGSGGRSQQKAKRK